MNALLDMALSNAAVCGAMAVILLPLARWVRRPALTHALCVLILLKLMTPPLFNVPLNRSVAPGPTPAPAPARQTALVHPAPPSQPSEFLPLDEVQLEPTPEAALSAPPAATVAAPRPSPGVISHTWRLARDHWRSWLLIGWAAGSAGLGAVAVGRIIALRRIVRQATVRGPEISADVELLSRRMRIARVPRVRFILGSPPPMLLATFSRPELIIPIRLWEQLIDRQRQTLLLHELAHLRRRDHWVRYLEVLATCLYWWHFAVWMARRALHEAEELCCDAWVVWAMPESSRTYMTTLLDAVDFLSQSSRPRLAAMPVLASGMGQFHNLQRRLTMVREQNVSRRLGLRGLSAIVLLSALALPVGARLARGDDRAATSAAADPTSSNDLAVAQQRLAAAARDQQIQSRLGVAPADPRAMTGGTLATSAAAQASNSTPAALVPANGFFDALGAQSAQQQDEVAKLEAELAAAQANVQRIKQQLDQIRSRSPRPSRAANAIGRERSRDARLGYMLFKYQGTGSSGMLSAFDDSKLMWTLNVPLNGDSGIRCYDNDTLLIKSADGYTRLVNAEDGKELKLWAPGEQAPIVGNGHQVNPFGGWAARSGAAAGSVFSPTPPASAGGGQDQEQRMQRMEENIRSLTAAVDQLVRQQQREQDRSSAPAKE